MSHKSKKPTLKRSAENFTQPQEQSLETRKKPRADLEPSVTSLETSQEISNEEETEELSQEEKNYKSLIRGAVKAIKKIPTAFTNLLKEIKIQPKREIEKFLAYGICKKGVNMGRIFSCEKLLPDFQDVPKSFKWRDEITIMDLIPFHGTTRGGREFTEMRTPSGNPINGLRSYEDGGEM